MFGILIFSVSTDENVNNKLENHNKNAFQARMIFFDFEIYFA